VVNYKPLAACLHAELGNRKHLIVNSIDYQLAMVFRTKSVENGIFGGFKNRLSMGLIKIKYMAQNDR
jgi:hypothetical protein